MTFLLEAKGISKTFFSPHPIQLFTNIHLSLKTKESIAIMGPSGVGKSTLLHILGTLEKPNSGQIFINGQQQKNFDPKARQEHLGFVFQSYHLLEEYTVLENVLLPALIKRNGIHKGSKAYEHAFELLDMVGLTQRSQFLCKHLSGGEKQRVAIARALCNDPSILLADEPTGNLDEGSAALIHSLLIKCVKELNKGLIVVTHNLDLARLLDKKFLLKNGILECVQ